MLLNFDNSKILALTKEEANNILHGKQWCNGYSNKLKQHFQPYAKNNDSYFLKTNEISSVEKLKEALENLDVKRDCVKMQNFDNKYSCYADGIKGYNPAKHNNKDTNEAKINISSTEKSLNNNTGCIFDAYPPST